MIEKKIPSKIIFLINIAQNFLKKFTISSEKIL